MGCWVEILIKPPRVNFWPFFKDFLLVAIRSNTLYNSFTSILTKPSEHAFRLFAKIGKLKLTLQRHRPLTSLNARKIFLKAILFWIPWSNDVKYLGVHLVNRQTFTSHVAKSVDKASLAFRILYSFLNRRPRLCEPNKLLHQANFFATASRVGLIAPWHI